MAKIQAVIFDLDGTLLNTLEDLTDSVNAALKQYGHPCRTIDQVRADVGNGIRSLMIRSVESGEAHPDFEAVFQAFRECYASNSQNKTKPYPGIRKLLSELKEDGMQLAVVSNKADFAVKALNAHYFGDLHMTAIGEREGIARKPKPDAVFEALRALSVQPECAIYVGDSEVDVETARNAGMPCISVLWGFRSKETLQAHGAQLFAETADEALGRIRTMGKE